MLTAFKDPVHKYEAMFIRILVYLVVLVVIGYGCVLMYDKVFQKPPIAEIPRDVVMTPAVVQDYINTALKNSGSQHQISAREATETQKIIEYRTQNTQPDFSYKVPDFSKPTMKLADEKMQAKAKEEGRDEVIKKQVDDKHVDYYGITNEKKIAWGIYADLDKDGSFGAYHRNDRVTISAGEKYKDKSITVRTMYDIIKH